MSSPQAHFPSNCHTCKSGPVAVWGYNLAYLGYLILGMSLGSGGEIRVGPKEYLYCLLRYLQSWGTWAFICLPTWARGFRGILGFRHPK